MRRLAVIVAVGAVLAAGAPAAEAQGAVKLSPKAQKHFDRALEAFGSHDYATASTEIELAYQIDPEPVLLFTWGQAERLSGNCSKALELYDEYLATNPNDDQVKATNTSIELCKDVTLTEPEQPDEPEEPAPTGPPAKSNNLFTHPLTIIGLVSIGIGGTVVVLGELKASGAEDETMRADFVNALNQATLLRRVGWITVGAGAAAVATSYILWRRGHRETAVSATVTDESAMMWLRGRF